MSASKPFTVRERRRICSPDFGRRPTNSWGAGDLPAPWAMGDVVELVGPLDGDGRLRGIEGPFYVVESAWSIDEGDGWYFRVATSATGDRSDRLHVAYKDRCNHGWTDDVNWMAPFRLVETADPEGLAKRERLLADGWSYESPPLCSECRRPLPRAATGSEAEPRGSTG